jgi:hypothetical protein
MIEGKHGRWPIDVGELGVPKADAVACCCSMVESVKGVRSHHFLLNKEVARLSPTWRSNCRCFVKR